MPDRNVVNSEGSRDPLSKEERSALMAKVKSKDTKPEELVRKLLFKAGFRYRKNVRNLLGKPDIVLPKYGAIVFVHGCFWHQHPGCKEATLPRAHSEYWGPKLQRNVERDSRHLKQLREAGWRVFVIWECELRPRCLQKTMDNLIESLRSGRQSLG